MRLVLSCSCCGGTDFNTEELHFKEIWSQTYAYYDDNDSEKVTCSKCGLEDYLENLTPKVEFGMYRAKEDE